MTVRLCFVIVAIYVTVLQLLKIGFWSFRVDHAIILLGICAAMGMHSDSLEIVWRKLGIVGRPVALLVMLTMIPWVLLTPGNPISLAASKLFGLSFLALSAFGLLHSLISPSRTLRFRQMKKYLRTLPPAQTHILQVSR